MDIQYAIDVFSTEEAIRRADQAVGAGVKCLEAGHVLVKAEGIRVVSELRRRYPDVEVVADLKTMDMGRDEISIAADAGADTAIVCAAASNGTLSAAAQEAARRDIRVLVSLMGVRDRVRRSRELIDIGMANVIAHRGIDDDFQWSDSEHLADLEQLAELDGIVLVLAGGIDSVSLTNFAHLPLNRVIVGRGITDAADPAAEVAALTAASLPGRREVEAKGRWR